MPFKSLRWYETSTRYCDTRTWIIKEGCIAVKSRLPVLTFVHPSNGACEVGDISIAASVQSTTRVDGRGRRVHEDDEWCEVENVKTLKSLRRTKWSKHATRCVLLLTMHLCRMMPADELTSRDKASLIDSEELPGRGSLRQLVPYERGLVGYKRVK